MRTTVAIADEVLELAKERAHARQQTLGAYLSHATLVEARWAEAAAAARDDLPVLSGRLDVRPDVDFTKNPWHWEPDAPDEQGLYHP